MFDIFYTGKYAPNLGLLPEHHCSSHLEARSKCRTKYFWLFDGSTNFEYSDFANMLHSFIPRWDHANFTHCFPLISQFGEQTTVMLRIKESGHHYQHWHPDMECKRYADPSLFNILKGEGEIDWVIDPNWCPNPFEADQNYTYIFGNPWYSSVEMPTVSYGPVDRNAPSALKYSDINIATVKAVPSNWVHLKPEIAWVIDSSWVPNPFSPPYIYVFGNDWYSAEEMPTVEYRVPGAVDYKYMPDLKIVKVKAPNIDGWTVLKEGIDWHIDKSWTPNPFAPPYVYIFGNPWYSAEEMPTVSYTVEGAVSESYCSDPVVTLCSTDPKNYRLLHDDASVNAIMDTWAPNPFDGEPYVYLFGSQWYSAEEMPIASYTVPGATISKFVESPRATLKANMANWSEVPEELDASLIDFSWVPPPGESPYIYHFGTDHTIATGLTYTVPGATELKFAGISLPMLDKSKVVDVTQLVSMFFVDMNNKMSGARFELLKLRYPELVKVRFMNGWIETIKRISVRSKTQRFWVISSENVYDSFNFGWHAAAPWQGFMTHVFGSQWQKWSDTFLINKSEFERHARWAKSLEEFPNLNFVKDQIVYRPDDLYDIYYIDHFDANSPTEYERILKRYPDVKSSRYVDNYLDTFKRIVSDAESEYIWIINSICQYSKFDFTWQPEPWQAKMLHVFPSGTQKFGDTFYMHVPTFKEQLDKLELLDWFDTVNYCSDQNAPRAPISVIHYPNDTAAESINDITFSGPYAVLQNKQADCVKIPDFSPSIWRKKDRVVHVLSSSGSVIMVPRDAKGVVQTQVYDYPYIMPHKELFVNDKPLDIVYISNGEPGAQKWYDHLIKSVPEGRTVHWIKGIDGRANAYKAAANISNTPWFLAVFAKLEVNPEFDWNWQPDYLQQPKHYIFNALNPVNGLCYGHMAMLAYNKKLVLETGDDHGLDFTLSKEHEVVDMLSGTAHFNQNPAITWRTAFRESIKLMAATDEASVSRLLTWRSVANGDHAKWSIAGSIDAGEYYKLVDGNMTELLKSFDWKWLDEYYITKYFWC